MKITFKIEFFVLTLNLLWQEKENISSDDQENSDSEAKESEKNDSIVDSGEEETTENTKDSMGLESENNMTSTEKVGTERDDHPKNADSQPKKSPESSSSEDDEMTEEVAKMRLLLEAKMKAELEMKLDKFKVVHLTFLICHHQ